MLDLSVVDSTPSPPIHVETQVTGRERTQLEQDLQQLVHRHLHALVGQEPPGHDAWAGILSQCIGQTLRNINQEPFCLSNM